MKRGADLGGALLRDVSRSFYLSIKALPSAVREPIGLAYLLARTSDTIADSADAPVATRLQALDAFGAAMQSGTAEAPPVAITAPKPSEQLLLDRLPEALQWLAEIEPADRTDIQWVLAIIIGGQREDLTRAWPMQTDAEVDQYTYQVAGCVGEFWTRLCLRHLPRYSSLERDQIIALGVRFGQGLQLVNILRDREEDARGGRQYIVPAAVACWTQTAHEHLAAAQQYIAAIRPWRVRYACILPWQLARQTFARMAVTSGRAKVPRRAVYVLMLRALPAAFSNRALASLSNDHIR